MKLLTKTLFFLTFALVNLPAHSNLPITYITGTYTTEKMLKFVRPALDQALLKQGVNPEEVAIKYIPHYEAYNALNEGHIGLYGRPKDNLTTTIGYQVPIAIFYNKKTLGEGPLNLTALDLKQITQNTIEGRPFKNMDRPLKISLGAISGLTKRSFALYTGLPYDKIKQTGESPYIVLLEDQFIHRSINELGYDIVAVPYPLWIIYFKKREDSNVGLATIDNKHPEDVDYPLHDTLYYASYNGKNLKKQKAIAEALKDPKLKEALKKIGVRFIEGHSDSQIKMLQQGRPDLYEIKVRKK